VIDEHAAAVLALLAAAPGPPALNVHDGKVPPGTDPAIKPYVLTYFDAGNPDLTFVGRSHTFQLGATCHSVGATARAARMVADRVRSALLDITPTVAGRKCYPIRWDSGVPPQRDESTGASVFSQVDVYILRSVPA
jgi:hypothetical protein